jgi:hypothetical protein
MRRIFVFWDYETGYSGFAYFTFVFVFEIKLRIIAGTLLTIYPDK